MGKYLNIYYKCMKTGKLPEKYEGYPCSGLCEVFNTYLGYANGDRKDWEFKEDKHDPYFFIMYNPSKRTKVNNSYWGGKEGEFTPLRQNIILFMAAMSGEL